MVLFSFDFVFILSFSCFQFLKSEGDSIDKGCLDFVFGQGVEYVRLLFDLGGEDVITFEQVAVMFAFQEFFGQFTCEVLATAMRHDRLLAIKLLLFLSLISRTRIIILFNFLDMMGLMLCMV